MLNTLHWGCCPSWGFVMTGNEAEMLARRIVNTFRLTPPLPEWIDMLIPLDHTQAVRTFTELRATVDGSLYIARFLDGYHARQTTPTRRDPRPDCEHCDGCGWVDGPDEFETIGGEPHTYPTVIPCRCRAGRQPTPAPASLFGDEP